MDQVEEPSRDLAALVVPQVGRLAETADAWDPYRLLDGDGAVVEAVTEYLRDLQAAGRSTATLRSYGLDLLRWFRFLWAVDIRWSQATRVEARDFCRWMLVAGKPARSHWRNQSKAVKPRSTVEAYAPSVRAHCETVLRCFYEFHLPRSVNMRDYTQAQFDAIADELNGRPRQTLQFATPSEQLARMLR